MSHVLCNFKFLHLSKSNDPLFAIFYISLKIVLNIWRFPPESTSDARSTNLINLIVYDERETKVFFFFANGRWFMARSFRAMRDDTPACSRWPISRQYSDEKQQAIQSKQFRWPTKTSYFWRGKRDPLLKQIKVGKSGVIWRCWLERKGPPPKKKKKKQKERKIKRASGAFPKAPTLRSRKWYLM